MSHITRERDATERRRQDRLDDSPLFGPRDDDYFKDDHNDDRGCFPKPSSSGTWFLSSKKDHRWNDSGQSDVGGFMMPEECEAIIESLKKKFGEPPDDLEWGYMKD